MVIEPLDGGGNLVRVGPTDGAGPAASRRSSYPADLIRLILDLKGPGNLLDEIARDEDPLYVQACLEKDIPAYLAPEDLKGKRLLDFGCGAGASTMILARMFPDTDIVGIDLSLDALKIARSRAEFYGLSNVRFLLSPAGDALPEGLGTFDYILLSAVFEHLLPNERGVLLPKVWSLLRGGGILFLDQTPWRYFPLEGHTTRLPFINYLPDRVAHFYATRFSRRVPREQSWQSLLRRGVRGGTVGQIMKILRACRQPGRAVLLKPHRLGLRDRIDVWHSGYALSIRRKYPKAGPIMDMLRYLFKAVKYTTGLTIVPSLSLAIQKAAPDQETQ